VSAWLVAFGEIEGLRWVMEQRRMAFSEGLAKRATKIRVGDTLLLYVTRGAFHNPTRDRSQLVGVATVRSPARRLSRPVFIAGRDFVATCRIQVETTLPERGGVPFEPLVQRMTFIRRKDAWGQYLRAGLIALPPDDFKVLSDAIDGGATR
jgi:hypothetical protein